MSILSPIVTSITSGILRPIIYTPNLQSYDYFIDATNGNDSNDGLTTATAWATISKIATLNPLGGEISVLVKSDTYDTADDFFTFSGGKTGTLNLTFEAGCVMDGTAANVAVPGQNGFEADSATTINIYGNGLIVQNYSEPSGGSPNGFGNRGTNIMRIYDCHTDNCDDGFSAHGDAQMYMYDCTSKNSEKGEFIHVDNAYVEAHRCTFWLNTGSNGNFSAGTYAILRDCEIIPAAGAGWVIRNMEMYNCIIGTNTNSVLLLVGGQYSLLQDCFLNCYADGNNIVDFVGCYGYLTTRMRNGGDILISGCDFRGGATGQSDSILFANFNPGSQGSWNVIDSIITGYALAVGSGFNATYVDYFEAAGNTFTYSNLFNNSTNFDADFTGTTADISTGVITTDPLLNDPAGSYDKADWGYGVGSPCIGAGSGGGNIGFATGS